MFPYALHLQYIYIGLQTIDLARVVVSFVHQYRTSFFINSIFKQCSDIVIDIKRLHESGVKTVD